MAGKLLHVGWGIVRETAFAAVYWVLALLGLYAVMLSVPARARSLAPRGEDPSQFGTDPVGPLEFMVDIMTLQWGVSYTYQAPVADVVFAALPNTLLVAAVVVAVLVALAAVVRGVVAATTDTLLEPVVAAVAYLASSVPPLVALVTTLFVFGVLLELIPFFWPGQLVDKLLVLMVAGAAVSVPFLGLFARRSREAVLLRRERMDRSRFRAAVALPRERELQSASLDLWTYASYLGGALAVLEVLWVVPGLANLWFEGLVQKDVPLVVGTTVVILFAFVALGYVRNLLWTVGRALARADAGAPAGDDDARAAATDGGFEEDPEEADGQADDETPEADTDDAVKDADDAVIEDAHGDPAAPGRTGEPERADAPDDHEPEETASEQGLEHDSGGPGGESTGEEPAGEGPVGESGQEIATGAADAEPPTVGEVARAVAFRPKVVVGALGLALLGVLGLVGSLALSAALTGEQLLAGPTAGFGPATVLNTIGSLVVVTLVAVVVATVLGASFGLLAGRFEGPVGTALRVPSDVWLLPPLLLLAGVWFGTQGAGDRTGFELVMGVLGGLVLAAYAFRSAQVAAAARTADGGSLRESLPVVVTEAFARVDSFIPFLLFVTADLAYLGLAPRPAVVAAFRLNRFTERMLQVEVVGGFVVLFAVAVALGAVGLCCSLLGDGLRAAVDEVAGGPAQ